MNIKQYLDSTYLKTAKQAGISEDDNLEIVKKTIQEAIDEKFKLVMIRPKMVKVAQNLINKSQSKVQVGTVIDFPKGKSTMEKKLAQAKKAILDGADDLDFVCNYKAFKKGEIALVKNEILVCTKLGLDHNKTVKWIIEVAALNNRQIIQLCVLIKNVVLSNFKEDFYASVFVKSSTGFYETKNNQPNGATIPTIMMMVENASPLSIKAAGGVRTYDEAIEMVKLGVSRIGTSGAKTIANHVILKSEY
jgi:deoxyribose-phosphate aldolase